MTGAPANREGAVGDPEVNIVAGERGGAGCEARRTGLRPGGKKPAHAEADKARKDLVETKNQAESLLHSTKKSLAEHSDKVDPSTVEAIELAMGPLEDALKGEDAGKIKGAIQNLTEAAMKLGEAIYKAQAANSDGGEEPGPRDVDDDIIDADFEDMGNNKRK